MPDDDRQPDLACIVLSLRAQPGLVEAVRSLLVQEEPAEIVVVNSGGEDATGALGAAGIDVAVLEHAERLLPGAARNVGILATRAPYVAFLAADCIAHPGWVAGRLREHRAGAAAVAGVLTNAYPDSLSACAAALFLHHRRAATAPPSARLLYGLSYDRRLFDRFGLFREDLRGGEDTEFNARLDAGSVAFAADVQTAHRNPRRPGELLGDMYRRGRRQAASRASLSGVDRRCAIAASALRNVRACLGQAWRVGDPVGRRRLMLTVPLVVPAALAYALGALTAPLPVAPQRAGAAGRPSRRA